jgi:3-methyl-2-oxobutanoate hydroxymethyltransferase
VLVSTDLLGMSRGHTPKFAKRYAELGDVIVEAVKRYVSEVQLGSFPASEHAYRPNRAEESGSRLPESPARVVALRR